MKYVEVVANEGSAGTIEAIAEKAGAQDVRFGMVGEDSMQATRILVSADKLQWVLDALQHILGAQPTAKIMVLNVEAFMPDLDEEASKRKDASVAAREAIYGDVKKNARLNINYFVLLILSTIVAAIGLIENNVAVVIGAMVIAPLLGPNLALSLGTALGDFELVKLSVKTLFIGIFIAISVSMGIGFIWQADLTSPELMSRTVAGFDTVALALASGAAGALSLTTGLSSTLVGVMVAVALLPPAATIGLMLSQGNTSLAIGAALLLAVNIVCVNLASKIVMVVKGIYPRTWYEKAKAKKAMVIYVIGWVITLAVLMIVIYFRQTWLA